MLSFSITIAHPRTFREEPFFRMEGVKEKMDSLFATGSPEWSASAICREEASRVITRSTWRRALWPL